MNLPNFTYDSSSKVRVANSHNLSDLKTLYEDNPLVWENVGTGTGTFQTSGNNYNMAVTAGQYLIRRSKQYFQYYAGNCQSVELTMDSFDTQANVVKRIGYFSSNAVAPYDSNKDGFWLENNGTNISLVVSHNGAERLRAPISEWTDPSRFASYDWSSFTVIQFDFLWLGGAVLRFFIKVDDAFVLAYQYDYPGISAGVFIQFPTQNVRYEIRSTTGTGDFNSICQRVATEGNIEDAGISQSANTGSTLVPGAVAGTTYPILAVRKLASKRHIIASLRAIDAYVGSNADQTLITLQINPTLSAPLTYSQLGTSAIESAKGDGTITVTSPGKILYSKYTLSGATFPANNIESDFLGNMGLSIADIPDQYIICATPITSTVTVGATFNIKEY